jgi:hypothetical protein
MATNDFQPQTTLGTMHYRVDGMGLITTTLVDQNQNQNAVVVVIFTFISRWITSGTTNPHTFLNLDITLLNMPYKERSIFKKAYDKVRFEFKDAFGLTKKSKRGSLNDGRMIYGADGKVRWR